MFFPPSQGLSLDIDAISGICGSISVACWVVVFSPQIIENFVRGSADGLSLTFLIVWLAGDFFNILGAVLQGVLPTMIILAIYYTFADIVLLAQCFYYRGFTLSDAPVKPPKPPQFSSDIEAPTETSRLLSPPTAGYEDPQPRRRLSSILSSSIDPTHLSPVTPLLDPPTPEATLAAALRPTTTLQAFLFNSTAILLVILAGIVGWYLSPSQKRTAPDDGLGDNIEFSTLGQVFGYLCAFFYLASRIPQLLLNYRRKSTEGVSLLFFLFACIGNLTYVMSILAFEPRCATHADGNHNPSTTCPKGEWGRLYARYILVNASWLIGSLGAFLLDCGILAQFLIYSAAVEGDLEEASEAGEDVVVYDEDAPRVVMIDNESGVGNGNGSSGAVNGNGRP